MKHARMLKNHINIVDIVGKLKSQFRMMMVILLERNQKLWSSRLSKLWFTTEAHWRKAFDHINLARYLPRLDRVLPVTCFDEIDQLHPREFEASGCLIVDRSPFNPQSCSPIATTDRLPTITTLEKRSSTDAEAILGHPSNRRSIMIISKPDRREPPS